MFKNYLKTAFRNVARNKAFSFINILGLALGMTCSLLIFLWVQDERNKDNFHTNAADLYNVYERVFSEGKNETARITPGRLAEELKKNIPEIRYSSGVYIADEQSAVFEANNKIINQTGTSADSDFFKMFSFPLIEGTPQSALSNIDNIAISHRMADNFFGSPAAAFGKTIRYNNYRDFRISAVFENMPGNSTMKYDFLTSWPFLLDTVSWLKEWIFRGPHTFIQLQPHADPTLVETKIKNFLAPYLKGTDGGGFRLELGIQRFDKMYLYSNFSNGKPTTGRIEYVKLFTLVAIFVLLIACINFMNLTTARASKRAKEVGIRKTIGALRFSLIIQFIGESLLLTILSLCVTWAIVLLLLPVFNQITEKNISLPVKSSYFWLSIAGLTFFTGVISGSYPALYLSALRPIKVLKGSLKFSFNVLLLRKGLVVFQFMLSILLIIGTIIVSRQVQYLQTKDLGFNKENLVYVPFQGQMPYKFPLFKQLITGMPGIKEVTRTDQPPTRTGAHAYDMDWEGKSPATKSVVIHVTVGYDFLKVMNLQLLEGRDFSRDFPTDSQAYIINETALKLIGYKEPIGKPLSIFQQKNHIIGVVKDFHFKSLHDPIEPLLINLNEHIDWGNALIKTKAGKTKDAIASLEKVCKQIEPKFPFNYFFVDEDYKSLYENEQTISRLSNGFAFLAVFISCLGLLGLTMFTAEQRTKEIGIRKAIGASTKDVFILLSSDILRLVFISALIASPIAWWSMNQWLQNYAYRTTASWWIFVIAGIVAVFIALSTISYQVIRSATANPVKSLRTD